MIAMKPHSLDAARKALVSEEGRVSHMYLDTTGNVTVGVGHLLAHPKDAESLEFVHGETGTLATADQIRAEFRAIKGMSKGHGPSFYAETATLQLPDSAIDALLDSDIEIKFAEITAAEACRSFADFPGEAQQALLDMAFNLGTSKLTHQFKKLMGCVEREDWAGCAEECSVRGVQDSRNAARADLFRAAARLSSESQDHDKQLTEPDQHSNGGATQVAEKKKKFRRIRSFLHNVAPHLATALIPGGPLVDLASDFVHKKLGKDVLESVGGNSDGNVRGILEKLSGTLEGVQKVKELERQFKLEMEKLEVDVFSLEVDDRKDARALALKDIRPHVWFSVLFIVAYFLVLGGVIWAEISPNFNPGSAWMPAEGCTSSVPSECPGTWEDQDESLIDLIHVLLGVLTAGLAQVLNFWFGGLMRRNQPAA